MSQALNAEMEYRMSCQKFLENLMASRDYDAACRYFDSIIDTCRDATDITSGIILRLGGKAFGLSGQLSKALILIRKAISLFSRINAESNHSAECYLVLGDILREMGKLPEAEKAYRDAESIFRRNDNYSRAGDALNRLAGILFKKGDFDASLSCLLEAVEYARKNEDNRKLAYLFGNIGRVYTLLGKLNEAEDNIRFNIGLSEEFDDQVELARANLSLGYIQIQKGEFEEAEKSLAGALEFIKRNGLAKEEIIYLTYSGELLLKMGELDGADYMLNQAASRSYKVAPESLTAARPLRHLAELLIKRQSYRKALQMVNKAMALMKKLDDSIEIGALLKLQAICHDALDQPAKATRLFGRAISILEEHRAKFELADALAEAGRSALYDNRQRMVYLCRAEEIYIYCGINVKATEMQRLIGSLKVDRTIGTGTPADDSFYEGRYITYNERVKKIVTQMGFLRDTDLPILLAGETGTGKDHLARYFHSIARPTGPFVAVNCAAVPDTLIESELFGYRKGAFTGADGNQMGLFLAANGGVLLLDEIGELPLSLQAKLLSVLETHRFRPLGSSEEVELDIILLAATNRDLSIMVEQGTFRQDLYYRLAGITFDLPALRDRKEDIPYLLEHFMRKYNLMNGHGKPEDELISMFVGYDWPGNIRQMENKIKHLSVLASMAKDGSIVELSRTFFDNRSDDKSESLFEQVEQFEMRLLKEALIKACGNKSQAARLLSIHESTLRAKMKKYGLETAIG